MATKKEAEVDLTEQAEASETPERRGESWFDIPDWFGRRWPEMFGHRFPELLERATGDLMRIEEIEQEGALIIRAELPGVDPGADVEITVDSGMLTIRAERREESTSEEGGRRRSEFRYGVSSRTLSLPTGALEDQVAATYTDGILEVRVPIDRETSKATKVQIQRG